MRYINLYSTYLFTYLRCRFVGTGNILCIMLLLQRSRPR